MRALNVHVENDQINLVEQLTSLTLEHDRLCAQTDQTRSDLDDTQRKV